MVDPEFEIGRPVEIRVFRARVGSDGGDGWVLQKGMIARRDYVPAGPGFKRAGWWYRVSYGIGRGKLFSLWRHEEDIRMARAAGTQEGA